MSTSCQPCDLELSTVVHTTKACSRIRTTNEVLQGACGQSQRLGQGEITMAGAPKSFSSLHAWQHPGARLVCIADAFSAAVATAPSHRRPRRGRRFFLPPKDRVHNRRSEPSFAEASWRDRFNRMGQRCALFYRSQDPNLARCEERRSCGRSAQTAGNRAGGTQLPATFAFIPMEVRRGQRIL